MATPMRCKFTIVNVDSNGGRGWPEDMPREEQTEDNMVPVTHSEIVKLTPIYSDSPEDRSFSDATPSGEIKLWITNKALHGKLHPGEVYVVDFTPLD